MDLPSRTLFFCYPSASRPSCGCPLHLQDPHRLRQNRQPFSSPILRLTCRLPRPLRTKCRFRSGACQRSPLRIPMAVHMRMTQLRGFHASHSVVCAVNRLSPGKTPGPQIHCEKAVNNYPELLENAENFLFFHIVSLYLAGRLIIISLCGDIGTCPLRIYQCLFLLPACFSA